MIDLKAEVAELLETVAGPDYVEEVWVTVNGEKHEKVKVNELQWWMFRYAELLQDKLDILDEPV